MLKLLIPLALLSGCSMFEKVQPNNEIQTIATDVIKKGEGVTIEFRPIPHDHAQH